VQHWWHGPMGAGVRTHCSDDLLWLPHAALHYVAVTGDAAVWDAPAPFIEGQAIAPGAEDAYFAPTLSSRQASLYEHCALTIERSLAVGQHGLPLMGTGDWNDGMNRVGHLGLGESVWLGWFLCLLVQDFAPVALARGDTERAARWQEAARGWRTALQSTAWDGEWFMRAFFDDGTPLGSQRNAACRIDLIAQAWAVLSGAATPAQQMQAMASARRCLMDEDVGLVRLLDPPFIDGHQPDAGYIQAYPPGVRENGGQYSHAAVWALMAQAALGDADGAYRSFTWLSPAHRSCASSQGPVYGLEPYVMAGDIYTQPPYVGRGGWSWYTGSASWLHRAAIESICGLIVRAGQVRVWPHLPSHWPQVTLTLRQHGHEHVFIVCASWAEADIQQALADGAQRLPEGAWLDLDGERGPSRHLVVSAGAARFERFDADAHASQVSQPTAQHEPDHHANEGANEGVKDHHITPLDGAPDEPGSRHLPV
jgi:cyclic beta-1,2-glucan synthetase